MKKKKEKFTALLAGMLSGFFGTGGGIPLWFASMRKGDIKKALATSSTGVLLLSLFSALLYANDTHPFAHITPLFLFLSVAGGAIGAALLGRVSTGFLKLLLAFLLIGSGIYSLIRGVHNAILV